jgi:CRP/FNR family transcriptional regulator, nitrogen fixation regulation protein
MSVQLVVSSDFSIFATPPLSGNETWLSGAGDAEPAKRFGPRPADPVAHFTQDREIYGEGDTAKSYFMVVSGVVRICKFLSDGRRQIEAFHGPGDLFGIEIGGKYSFTAEAVCDCTVISYRQQGPETFQTQDKILLSQLLAYAMQNLARAQEHLLLLGRRSAMERVAAFLVDWAEDTPDGAVATLAMSRQDIADYLGLTIETVSRTLSQLERDALIELSTARQIRLTDPDALRDMNA